MGQSADKLRMDFVKEVLSQLPDAQNQAKNTIISPNLCGSKATLPLLVTA